MKYNKSMIIIMLAIFLVSIAAVSASDVNETAIASGDDSQIELSAGDEITGDNLQTSEENPTLAVDDNDETVSAQTNSEILSDGQYNYTYLREQIRTGGNINLTKGTYTYNQNDGDTIKITDSGVINGNGAIIDMAEFNKRAFEVTTSGVTFKNLTIKNANYNGYVGAIEFSISGSVENCNFTNNKVTGNYGQGGAVYFGYNGKVINCNFINNTATNGNGGAIYMDSGTVTNCNFINNTATNGNGGAIYMDSGTVTNCNFTDNTANGQGGAVYFWDEGTVTNCNFTNNSAKWGGAIYFEHEGTVTNCNFTDNSATGSNNWGGAIRMNSGTVTNCNFTANQATFGGAVYFFWKGTVTNCNFTGNNATTGSAIYFYWESDTKTVSNSRLLNNRADTESLEVTKNENNITITFTGNNNLLNAIYSRGDVTFTNVAYWGANGIANTGSSPTTPTRSNKEAGQNITVNIVVNNVIVLNKVITTDENGMIVLDISAGANYYISARHETDSYYTEAETINSTMKFNVNVTSQTTNNKTVNITAKSNIPNEIIDGKLLFIVPNTDPINATYAGNGTWWAVHTFDDYTSYEVNATYRGLDNVTISNATITINKANSTLTVGDIKFDYNSTGSTNVSFTGATGVTASVVGQPNANVSISGNTITVSGLNAGTYNLTVTTIADANHNNITKTANITVNKIDSTLTVDNVVLDYGKTTNVTAITEGAEGITAKIDNDDAAVNGNTISIPSLDVGNYTLTVTTIADANHNNITKTANITVNKIDSTLTVGDIVFDYNSTGSATISYDGASGVNASVIDQPKAVVNVKDDIITVSGLNAGNYTLSVTTIADANHNNVTKTAAITVNKIKTELTAAAITATYNIDKDLVITLNDSNGKALSGVNVTVDLNGVKEYTTDENGQVKVSTSGLAPETYTANITFNGTDIYDKSAKDVNVTVKKATPKLIAKAKTFKTTTKTKKYTITLKDNTGKAIKNAKVTLKVNGKTYYATTNSKGKATFKITKLNRKGTYKATVTYKANKYYNKATKKVKITVKSVWKTVSKGCKDKNTVKKIQKALKDNGYYLSYKGHYLMIDGKYESCTERSVKEFQHDKGLKVTGKVDEKTAKKLKII